MFRISCLKCLFNFLISFFHLENYTRTYKLLTWILIISGATYYGLMLFFGEVPKDDSDGLQHFSLSKESWNQADLFLAHWGKPFFILFSSPFSQFGFYGYILFNILVYVVSCRIVLKILEHYETPGIIGLMFPLVLITIPDYSYSIVGGMTEPFFGLILLFLFLLAINEKWFWFSILISFTPFARSEGMLLVLAAVPYLLLLRKWKYIPLLLTGFVIYAIVGWIILEQPLWYFENDPYPAISIYGSGPWHTYITSIFNHTGLIAVIFAPIALFGLLVWRSKGKRSDLIHILFFSGIYLGIIVIHSYLWTEGLRGALGLSRLGTLGLLPLLVIECISLGFVLRELNKMVHAFAALCIGLLIFREIMQLDLPAKATIQQKTLLETSIYLENNQEKARTIYYFHPMIGYYFGLTTKSQNKKFQHRYIHLKKDVEGLFMPGDLIVRDSKFGALEQGLPLEELKKYPWIIPVKHFYIPHYYVEASGEAQSVIIYEVMDKETFKRSEWENKRRVIETKFNKKPVVTKGIITTEFFGIDTLLKLPELYGPRQELVCHYSLETKGKLPVHIIFNSESGYYVSVPLDPEKQEITLPFVTGNIMGVLFVHNPGKQPYQLTFEQKSWRQTLDSGILSVK